MITYDQANNRFNFRVAGIAINKGRVLLHRCEGVDFWALPGGRVELQEDTKTTIIREMKEEIDEAITVERLVWCCENFFRHMSKDYHELCFYYLITFNEDASILKRQGAFEASEIDGAMLTYKWFEFDEIKALYLLPDFLKEGLLDLPATMAHIIYNELE